MLYSICGLCMQGTSQSIPMFLEETTIYDFIYLATRQRHLETGSPNV